MKLFKCNALVFNNAGESKSVNEFIFSTSKKKCIEHFNKLYFSSTMLVVTELDIADGDSLNINNDNEINIEHIKECWL